MIRVALKGLRSAASARLLTALAIVLGVAMISGTYVLTDTIDEAFDGIFNASYKDTERGDLRASEIVKGSRAATPTVPSRCWYA